MAKRQVIVKDIHSHKYGKSGKAITQPAIHPQQRERHWFHTACCGFPIDLDVTTICPLCGSENITGTNS